jgi:aarF domain-containing kinase
VKQISGRARETLGKVMIALDGRESDDNPDDLEKIGNLALELGVELNDDAQKEAPAAVAFWLFDGLVDKLPGGYDKGELSPNSPVKELKSFPQDLVLVGRSSILIKGLSSRLGVPWSLASEWAPIAKQVITPKTASLEKTETKVRLRDVTRMLKAWSKGKVSRGITSLPAPMRKRVAALILSLQKRRESAGGK